MVERVADRGEAVGAEIRLTPCRRVSGRQQQLVGLTQRQVEGRRQAEHHLAAGLGAAKLEEAQVTLGALSRRREAELGEATPLAPPGKTRGKGERGFLTT